MTIPVYVPDWQIGDGDIAHPSLGMALRHVLLFHTDTGDPQMRYGSFGHETTVKGVAVHLADHAWHTEGTFPTAISCDGFALFWDAPVLTEGTVRLTGIISTTDYGTAPAGFPETSGRVESMELASLSYVNECGGIHWEPAPDSQQTFRPISHYPRYAPKPAETGASRHTQVTGVVLHLDTAATTAKTEHLPSAAADGSLIRIRVFPDYADTVLWCHGPVGYTDAALSPGLAAGMAAWEQFYYDSLDGNQRWKSHSGAAQFTATGSELAQLLAEELGDGFEVEFHSYAPGSSRQLFSVDTHSRNPAAAAAFRGIEAAEEELQARFAADQGDGVGWFAYAPLSGTVFDPNNTLPPGFDPEPPLPENGPQQ